MSANCHIHAFFDGVDIKSVSGMSRSVGIGYWKICGAHGATKDNSVKQ